MSVTSELSTMVEADLASVRVARRFVQSVLAEHVSPEISSDLMLGTSELVTNAVEYGSGSAIQVTVSVSAARVAVTVSSAGGGDPIAPIADWQVAAIGSLSGRGLGIVRAVADDVSVDQSAGALSITMTRAVAQV